jgi:coatomer subunit beta'
MWVSNDCFVYSNLKGQIHYLIGQKTMKLANADKKQYLLGYDGKQNKLYTVDKNFNVYAYHLFLSVVNYQSAILSEDLHGAEIYFKDIPDTQYTKLAKFLESNDRKELAFDITPDQDHKFDLAISLNKTDQAFRIAEEQQSVEKWKKVGDIALVAGVFSLAETCFKKAKDFNSLLFFYSSYGDEQGLLSLLEESEADGKYNVAFEVAYLLALPERCVDILVKARRFAEAA